MKKIIAFMLSALSLVSFSQEVAFAKSSTSINQKENKDITSSIGDTIIKVTLKESLPNAFGGSDIFGRKRERGFVEIRYMGMSEDGKAIFRRRTLDIYSDETTMSRSGPITLGSGNIYNGSGNFSSVTMGGQNANVEVLPADTIEFALDLTKSKFITVEDRLIEIVTADPASVTFKISKK